MASPRKNSNTPSLSDEWNSYQAVMDNLWNHSHPTTGKPSEITVRGATFREMSGWRTFLENRQVVITRVAGIGQPIIDYATIQRRNTSTLIADHLATLNAVNACISWLNGVIPTDGTEHHSGLTVAQLAPFVTLLATMHDTIED